MAWPPPIATYCGHDMKMLGLTDLDFAGLMKKPGDCVAWGQAGAEALPLAQAPQNGSVCFRLAANEYDTFVIT